MKYRSNQRYKSTFGFVDLLFNLLIGFVFLFIIAFIMINPVSKKSTIDPKAEFLIIMTWPTGDRNDIDLWIKHNKSEPVSFRSKDNGIMHLDRDDLGFSNDTVIVDGLEKYNPVNREVISIRQKISGHYVVNAHWYAYRRELELPSDSSSGPVPVPVEFTMIQVNPYVELATSKVILMKEGSEQTGFQFKIHSSGEVYDINYEQDYWVQEHVINTEMGN